MSGRGAGGHLSDVWGVGEALGLRGPVQRVMHHGQWSHGTPPSGQNDGQT